MATFYNRASLSYAGTVTNSNTVEGELLVGLSMTKSAATSDYGSGDSITYVVSIVNVRNTPYTGLTVTDNLGSYTFGTGAELVPLTYIDGSLLYYQNGTIATGATAVAGPPLSITGITVPANGNVTLIYEARANEFAPLSENSTITNTATINSAGLEAPLTDSAIVNARNEAELTLAKSLTPEVISDDGILTYTFVIQNTGNVATSVADNVVITDTFNPILTNITVSLNGTELAAGTGYNYNEATGEFSTVDGAITIPAATYDSDPTTGVVTTTPGVAVLTVTGTVNA